MVAITISRHYGSGGRKVALRVSKLLGWRLFDKRLMLEVASEVGLTATDLVDFTEDNYRIKTLWDHLFGGEQPDPATKEDATKAVQMDEEWYVNLTSIAIHTAYTRGNIVIVGRGGQMYLQDKPDVLHVRIEAPMHIRTQRLQTLENISPQEAVGLLEGRDKASMAYMKRFFDVRWDDPNLYHLIINTGKWDIETAAHLIVHAIDQLQTRKTQSGAG